MNTRSSTLDNGLRIVTEDMPHLETASIGLWVDVGARCEGPETNGVSHLLEHMAFKGTERRTAQAIAEEIEAVGGHLNAYTSREHTAYYAKVMKEDIGLALDILADIMQHSVFDEEELARERAVVIQEIAQTNDTPDDLVFEHFQAAAFPNQPIGRSILGPAKQVAAYSRDVLANYMSSHYSAERMVLVGAGRLDHDWIVSQAAAAFDALPPVCEHETAPAAYSGGEKRDTRALEQVHLVLGFDGISYDHDDFYTLQLLSTVLGGGMSSRLFQEVREKRGLAYSVFSFASSYVDGGLFGVYAGTAPSEVDALIPVLADEMLKVGNKVDAEEVARARAQLKSGLLMSLESSSSRCERLGRHLLIFGRTLPIAELIEKIDAITEADVTRLAERLFSESNLTVATVGPDSGLESYDRIAGRFAAG